MEKEVKRRIIKKYIFISFLLIAIIMSILLMVKYNVEGETNMPFKLSKIIIKSSVDAQSNESENLWDLDLMQNNDVYIYIEKNKNASSEEKIKSVKIERMTLVSKNKVGNIQVLLPTSNNIKTLFKDSTADYLNKSIEYTASTLDNLERQEICQDGGMLAIRVSNNGLGKYVANEGDEIQYNASLLEKAGITEEDIKFTLEMDLIIQTEDDKKYKGTVSLDLPVDSFKNSGIVDKEITDFSNVIFKRSE